MEEVWLAGLAAAIMTGIKTCNPPLLLPCLVAVAPALKHLRRRWAVGILMAVIALVISVIPTGALNLKHTGSWTVTPAISVRLKPMTRSRPSWAIVFCGAASAHAAITARSAQSGCLVEPPFAGYLET